MTEQPEFLKSKLDEIRLDLKVRHNVRWLDIDEDIALEKNRLFLQESAAFKRQWLNWLGVANGGGVAFIFSIVGNAKFHNYAVIVLIPSIIAFLLGLLSAHISISAASNEARLQSELYGKGITHRRIFAKIRSVREGLYDGDQIDALDPVSQISQKSGVR